MVWTKRYYGLAGFTLRHELRDFTFVHTLIGKYCIFTIEQAYSSRAQVCVRLSVVSDTVLYLYRTILGRY
jgi:hypothetical protein